jgi:hypothetical protein
MEYPKDHPESQANFGFFWPAWPVVSWQHPALVAETLRESTPGVWGKRAREVLLDLFQSSWQRMPVQLLRRVQVAKPANNGSRRDHEGPGGCGAADAFG